MSSYEIMIGPKSCITGVFIRRNLNTETQTHRESATWGGKGCYDATSQGMTKIVGNHQKVREGKNQRLLEGTDFRGVWPCLHFDFALLAPEAVRDKYLWSCHLIQWHFVTEVPGNEYRPFVIWSPPQPFPVPTLSQHTIPQPHCIFVGTLLNSVIITVIIMSHIMRANAHSVLNKS